MAISSKAPKKEINKKSIASDAELLAGLVLTPLYKNPDGISNLSKMVSKSQDPADALAHGLFMLMSKVRNTVAQQKLPIDNRAWLANGGAVDKVIIDVGGLLASTAGPQFVDKEFGKNVKMDIMKIMHQEEKSAGGKGDPNHPDNQPVPEEAMPQGAPAPDPTQAGPPAPEGSPQGLAAPAPEEMQ